MKISGIDLRRRLALARFLVAAQFLSLGTLTLLALLRTSSRVHPYLIFEIILAALSLVLIIVATFNLKPALKVSPIPKRNAPLISFGVYKYVRHPMYLAVILIGASLAGYAESLAGWFIEVFLILALNIKASFEDALILEAHPEALHFQMHTSKLIPCMGNTCRSNCALSSES